MSHCSPVKSTSPAAFKPRAATDGEFESAKHLPYAQIAICSGHHASGYSTCSIGTVSVFSKKHLLRCLVMDGQAGSRILQGYADS